MDDTISRQAAIDAIEPTLKSILQGNSFKAINVMDKIRELPSAKSDSCNGCKWENAFGYGECHHCKRRYDDMYEVKDDE